MHNQSTRTYPATSVRSSDGARVRFTLGKSTVDGRRPVKFYLEQPSGLPYKVTDGSTITENESGTVDIMYPSQDSTVFADKNAYGLTVDDPIKRPVEGSYGDSVVKTCNPDNGTHSMIFAKEFKVCDLSDHPNGEILEGWLLCDAETVVHTPFK